MTGTRVTVLGAGIIGLTVADELQRRGHTVTVVDKCPARGSSYAAAGMLSPAAELWHDGGDLLRLGMASLAMWPTFAARLDVELRCTGTLLVGYDAGDLQHVQRQVSLLATYAYEADLLARPGIRAHEPVLARVAGGALLPAEASVDPRAVCAALLRRVHVVPNDPDRADVTVIATGARLPAPWTAQVRGVRGEILRVRSDDAPTRTVRGWVGGFPIYLVPRQGGEVVIGATSEEHSEAPGVTAGGVLQLLAAARRLWPALDRAELIEATARDRPATTDGLPLIGPSGRSDVVLAAGHHRHGVLLAPLTAAILAGYLDTSVINPTVDPRRFIKLEDRESHQSPTTPGTR